MVDLKLQFIKSLIEVIGLGGGGGWISRRLSRRHWHLTIVY